MEILAELSLIPLGVGVSLSKYIAECERILSEKDLTVVLHAEGTNIEGDFDQVIAAVKECITTVHQMGAPRIVTNLKISSRTDKQESLKSRVESVRGQVSPY